MTEYMPPRRLELIICDENKDIDVNVDVAKNKDDYTAIVSMRKSKDGSITVLDTHSFKGG